MSYDNTNTGVLFKNDKQGNEKRPDYTGKINVDGKDYQLSAWIKDGQKGKFMSLSVQEPLQKSEPASQKQEPAGNFNDMEDEIPF